MAISTTIPENWRLPLFWAVVDGSLAGSLTESQPALLVGHMLAATGVAVPNIPIPIGSLAIAKQQFGEGSMLERMVARFLDGNTTQQLWCLPVPPPSAGTAATWSITFAATNLQSGVLSEYVAGQLVAITVYSTDTPTIIATNFAAAVNAMTTLPVVAGFAGNTPSPTVTLTCKWTGLSGNDIDIRANYRGFYGGESMPAGLTQTVTAMGGGTGNPDFTAAITYIQSKHFYHVGMPFTDSGSESIWGMEFGFLGRWSYTRQQYGWIYQAYRATYANALTWGLAQNSPVISSMAIEVAAPSPVWEWTAAYCAQGSAALLDDPARPLQTLEMPGVLVATVDQRFSQAQLNNLTNSGLAIQGTAPSGNAMILREATQYQRNQFGQADTAFALITVLSNLAEILSRMKAAITSKYPRHKLAPDGTRFGPGQAIITPIIAKAELVAELRQLEYDGLTANVDAAKKAMIVEIDNNNPNRLNVLHPPQLMGQLRTFAVLEQFRLQYPTISLT